MKLRIGIVSPHPVPRTETYKIGRLLAEKGHDVTVFLPYADRIETESWEGVEIKGFKTSFLPMIQYPLPRLSWPFSITKEIANYDFDIVQACDYDYLTSLIPLLSRRIPFSRRIITSDAFPGYNWRFGLKPIDFVGKVYTASIGRLILKGYSRFVVLHEKMVHIAKRLGVPENRIKVIGNGVDSSLFKRVASTNDAKEILGYRKDSHLILYVGRLSFVKGIDILLKAAEIVHKKDEKIKFVIIGDGGEKDRLMQDVTRSNVDIQFVPRMSQKRLSAWYSAADMLVIPSRSEGVPNTMLEAAAVGLPIIATDVGGISTFLKNEINGMLIPPGSAMTLADKISYLLSNPDQCQKMVANAREEVLKHYRWPDVVQSFESVYESMILDKV